MQEICLSNWNSLYRNPQCTCIETFSYYRPYCLIGSARAGDPSFLSVKILELAGFGSLALSNWCYINMVVFREVYGFKPSPQ